MVEETLGPFERKLLLLNKGTPVYDKMLGFSEDDESKTDKNDGSKD